MPANGLSRTSETDSRVGGFGLSGICTDLGFHSEDEFLSGPPGEFARDAYNLEIELLYDKLERVFEVQVLTVVISACSFGGLLVSVLF